MSEILKHEYGADGKCVACGQMSCGDAFWALVGKALGMPEPSDGTRGLRLRPEKAPEWILPDEPPMDPQ